MKETVDLSSVLDMVGVAMKKTKLSSYKLSSHKFLGFKWQHTAEFGMTYDRYFPSVWELRKFIEENFGVRVWRRIASENVNLIP